MLAIACGVVEGRQLGDNARAALITRGLAEIVRLGTALGGRAETLMGLSGLGDLTLTCTSLQSRNMSLGFALGQGRTLAEILVPEGQNADIGAPIALLDDGTGSPAPSVPAASPQAQSPERAVSSPEAPATTEEAAPAPAAAHLTLVPPWLPSLIRT